MTPTATLSEITLWRADVSAKTTWLLLCLRDAAGNEGWGEATSFGNEVEIAGLAAHLRDLLNSEAIRGVQPLLAALRQSEIAPGRRALLSALEQAGLDLAARRAGLPLAEIMGGARCDAVPFYANINRGISDRSPKGFADRARAMIETTGACAVKIAPFDGYRWDRLDWPERRAVMEQGFARVDAVRQALAGTADVFVDCHARFDLQGARTVIAELCRIGVAWIEEPADMHLVAPEDQRRLRAACHSGGARLAGGENVTDCAGMAALLADGGHDVVLPDLRLTGVQEGVAMLRLAAASGVAASLHNPVGPVLDAISVEVAASLPAFLILERQIGESDLTARIRPDPAAQAKGRVAISDTAGFGFVPDTSALDTTRAATPGLASFTGTPGAGPDA
ncbi:mandelate racemase/muconate lactonizing enzyme family protein [Marinovum sp.]|uniref:mandelate racemase/muconate lactonizing enzyme family protein n=1 Tax=Marinovum sp. TaxID=2024839 RepID=UPI002B27720C|nr:enolase C-terminal domain-like protein [Marinovum sp.]